MFQEMFDEKLIDTINNLQMMASIWPKLWDLTYAHSAMFTGAGFNHGLQDLFLDSLIEDLWIPYFCISTDIRLINFLLARM